MTNKRIFDDKLVRLIDALVEEALSAPDDEILADFEQLGLSRTDIEAQALADLDEALARVGKAKLLAARAAVAVEPRRKHGQRPRSIPDARKRLARAFAPKETTRGRMTLAARLGQDMPDEDIEGLIEDAADLGIDIDKTEDSPDSG